MITTEFVLMENKHIPREVPSLQVERHLSCEPWRGGPEVGWPTENADPQWQSSVGRVF